MSKLKCIGERKMREKISSKELMACADAASKRAVERAKARQIPYTVQEGKKIVQYSPDGRTKVLQTLPKAYVKLQTTHFKIV